MKRIRLKILLLVLISVLLFVLVGCSAISSYQKSVYNDDGKILKKVDSSTYKIRVGNTIDGKLDIKYETFNGMETIWNIKSEGKESLTMEYNSKIDNGKFKVVLVTPDDEVVIIVDENKEDKFKVDLKKGVSRVKLVGNEASGKIYLNIHTDGDAVIKKN